MKQTRPVQHQGVHFAQVELRLIEERTEVFQHREALQEYHVGDLVGVLKQGRELDPVTLWEEPESAVLVLVDGHHRLAAYRQARWAKLIPAQVHKCDRKTARLLATADNGKARLPFTKMERMNAAWALVCDSKAGPWTYSRSEVVIATGVSDGSVSEMRRTRKRIEENSDADIDPSWYRVLAAQRGQTPKEFTDVQRDAMIEAKTAKLDEKVGSSLGFYAQNQPEAAINVILKRCNHECRHQLYEELMSEFDPERLVVSSDY